MKISAKKLQSQVHRTVTSRKVTQDNGNINNFRKGSHRFCRQCVRILLFLTTEISKTTIWKTTFVSGHLDTVQSQQTNLQSGVVTRKIAFSVL